jgi:hypothetical protein
MKKFTGSLNEGHVLKMLVDRWMGAGPTIQHEHDPIYDNPMIKL